jgi:hypothetical protein
LEVAWKKMEALRVYHDGEALVVEVELRNDTEILDRAAMVVGDDGSNSDVVVVESSNSAVEAHD